jgi:hypothetical protein
VSLPQEIRKACRFGLAEDIEAVVVQWLRNPWLVHQWDACLSAHPLFLYPKQSLNWFHSNMPHILTQFLVRSGIPI